MLAGVPRVVAELLRTAGIPATPLPRVPLAAAGTGRFVLFDSRDAHWQRQMVQLTRLGLTPIDFRELTEGSHCPGVATEFDLAAARHFLDRLKIALEHQGGAWVRIADYPFPWQSAVCLAVEHPPELVADFPLLAGALPRVTTHFLSGRIRGEELESLVDGPRPEVGWYLTPDDFESSRRKTISHWQTRLARFSSVGLQVEGLFVGRSDLPIPTADVLQSLGLSYSCESAAGNSILTDHTAPEPEVPWSHFPAVAVPAPADYVEWLGEHYQAGCPLILHASTAQAGLVSSMHEFISEATRCSLMWQATLGELARWHRTRRNMKLQVWRRANGFEIHADGELAAAPWGLEIWRGAHVATVPLQTPELHVADEGLIYIRAHKRHPGGAAIPNDAVLDIVSPPPHSNQFLAA